MAAAVNLANVWVKRIREIDREIETLEKEREHLVERVSLLMGEGGELYAQGSALPIARYIEESHWVLDKERLARAYPELCRRFMRLRPVRKLLFD